jgi:anti-sigma factor RsiW
MLHPAAEEIEAYVDGSLAEAERVVFESHLTTCGRCVAEVDEWRALFAALASLPALEPTAGFADRVMAGVELARPWPARLAALLRRLVPTTTRAWLLLTALLALPVVCTGGALTWVLSRPWLSPEGLWLFARTRAIAATFALLERLRLAMLENELALQVAEGANQLLTRIGVREFGAAAALVAVLISLSVWILYQNLFRTSTRRGSHATT